MVEKMTESASSPSRSRSRPLSRKRVSMVTKVMEVAPPIRK